MNKQQAINISAEQVSYAVVTAGSSSEEREIGQAS
jgi:hypothetical protein